MGHVSPAMRSPPWLRAPAYVASSLGAVALALGFSACSGAGFAGRLSAEATDDAGTTDDASAEDAASADDGGGSLTCKGTRADCNKKSSDGCEVDTASNPKNCGSCGHACSGSQVCSNGKCESQCPAQLTTCGGACVDVTISVEHCGGCNKPCTAPTNATATCDNSQCGYECNGGYEACSTGCCEKQQPPPPPPIQPGGAVAAGGNHTCAITSTGALKCWGSNGSGKLGDNSMNDHYKATLVQTLTSGVVAVGCGDVHTCALLTGGEVRCWGGNTFGQLGTGDNTLSKVPTSVSGLSSGALAVSVGKDFACAIVTGGAVKCWGANDRGQLGDGTNDNANVPVQVNGLAHSAVALAAGTAHACALLDDASIACWGANDAGQLGDGTTDDSNQAVAVASAPANAVALASGFSHTCARTSTNEVFCWGSGASGQLGNGGNAESHSPVQVTSLSNAAALDNGSFHTCIVDTQGGMACWGQNSSGQVGDGTTTARNVPTAVINLTPAVMTDVAGGSAHTCAKTQGGNIKCWGANSRGQLGNGTNTSSATPVNVQNF